jgi:Lamin Tail Domain
LALFNCGLILAIQCVLKMKKRLFQSVFLSLCCSLTILTAQIPGDIVINEFLADNQTGAKDEKGQTEDWIELYNRSNNSYDLKGFRLTDNKNNPDKWDFPQGAIIGPKGYLVVWCDEDSSQGPLHVNFKLAATGEFLMLSAPNGTVYDSLSFGQQFPDISTGRFPNGTGPFTTMPTTFAAQNSLTSDLVEVVNQTNLRLYPNPGIDALLLSSDDILGEIEVWNATGQILLRADASNHTMYQLSLHALDSGCYWLKTSRGAWRKFVVQR